MTQDQFNRLKGRTGLAVVESPDRVGGVTCAWQLARFIIPAEHQGTEIYYASPEGAKWTIDELAQQLLYQQAFEPLGDQRVIIVAQADRMDARTSEYLLKTVEEPPSAVLFVFVVQDASSLLTTLQGRANEVIQAPGCDKQNLAHRITAATGSEPSAGVLDAAAQSPLLAAALEGEQATTILPGTRQLFTQPDLRSPFTAGYQIAHQVRDLAAALTGKAKTSPATKAAVTELTATLLHQWQRHYLAHAGNSNDDTQAATWLTRRAQVDTAQQLLDRHLPIEHALITALTTGGTP